MSRFKAVTSSSGLLAIDNIKIRCITKEMAIIRWETTVYAARYSNMESQYAMQLDCFIDDHRNFKAYSNTIKLPYYEFNTTKKFSHMIRGLKNKLKYKINMITYEIKNANPVELTKFSITYSNNIKYYNEYIIASYFARKYCTQHNYNKIDEGIFVFIASMLNYVHFETNHPKVRANNDNLTANWHIFTMEKYATIIFGEFLCARNEQIFEAKFNTSNKVGQNATIRFGFVTQEFVSGYENDNYDIHQFDYNSVVCFADFYNNDQMRVRSKFKIIQNKSQFNNYKLKTNDIIIVEINMKTQNGNV